MKVKVIKRQQDFLVDYMHEKDIHAWRCGVLEFFAGQYCDRAVLYIDTNNRIRELQAGAVGRMLEDCGFSYIMEPVEKSQRKLMDIGRFFRKASAEKAMTESIILAGVNRESRLRELYDGFLRYYDYGLGAGASGGMTELLPQLKMNAAGALFNRDVFPVSFYDSILYCRTRTDAPYEDFEPFLKESGIHR